jgi:hypothetical protein
LFLTGVAILWLVGVETCMLWSPSFQLNTTYVQPSFGECVKMGVLWWP